ncbi:hypothetical protein DFA_03506 [Cavenderia fasciculata]|uniref:Uncharacterized protein n=1 Tax=Cavenderia fasciculata TaxID=261658 RepID=F4PHS4_CACFS|nr:uncharacterized protein DFA_03506 [Cavenderia fasciculata]EGG25258.1 hypothetical protein DFA_03506 [Cavenderia fasciculata]|eukprot:XP_004363109.1 hypothetical protein DFA_03506 [Cavenderia fasciculata]
MTTTIPLIVQKQILKLLLNCDLIPKKVKLSLDLVSKQWFKWICDWVDHSYVLSMSIPFTILDHLNRQSGKSAPKDMIERESAQRQKKENQEKGVFDTRVWRVIRHIQFQYSVPLHTDYLTNITYNTSLELETHEKEQIQEYLEELSSIRGLDTNDKSFNVSELKRSIFYDSVLRRGKSLSSLTDVLLNGNEPIRDFIQLGCPKRLVIQFFSLPLGTPSDEFYQSIFQQSNTKLESLEFQHIDDPTNMLTWLQPSLFPSIRTIKYTDTRVDINDKTVAQLIHTFYTIINIHYATPDRHAFSHLYLKLAKLADLSPLETLHVRKLTVAAQNKAPSSKPLNFSSNQSIKSLVLGGRLVVTFPPKLESLKVTDCSFTSLGRLMDANTRDNTVPLDVQLTYHFSLLATERIQKNNSFHWVSQLN